MFAMDAHQTACSEFSKRGKSGRDLLTIIKDMAEQGKFKIVISCLKTDLEEDIKFLKNLGYNCIIQDTEAFTENHVNILIKW